MMPEDDVYGAWPRSGEIDIAEFRGNDYEYPEGRDFMASTLHWGPSYQHDAYIQTHGTAFLRRKDFTTGFHTFGLEWTENYIFMYLDSRLKQVHYTKFNPKNPLWKKGGFATLTTENGTLFDNPWKNGGPNAPFDQKFYLILNVAVGAQNGWFWDGYGKPWVDGSDFAARDFWKGMCLHFFSTFCTANNLHSQGRLATNLGRGQRARHDCQVSQDVATWQLLNAHLCQFNFSAYKILIPTSDTHDGQMYRRIDLRWQWRTHIGRFGRLRRDHIDNTIRHEHSTLYLPQRTCVCDWRLEQHILPLTNGHGRRIQDSACRIPLWRLHRAFKLIFNLIFANLVPNLSMFSPHLIFQNTTSYPDPLVQHKLSCNSSYPQSRPRCHHAPAHCAHPSTTALCGQISRFLHVAGLSFFVTGSPC
jgi:hypothetical protein